MTAATTTHVPDFRSLTVEDLAGMVRGRVLTAVAVTEHALQRISELNPTVNAFVAVDEEAAIAQATTIDEQLDKGEDVGLLAGVPIGVKDLADASGFATTRGAVRHRNAEPAVGDSVEVARLKAAGCVVLGKTNTPEYGCMADTYNPLFGATLNPWNLQRSPGGSSGGTAAAIASGMIPMGTGSDGGGSIRIPSAVCGLSGFKTSQGRVPSGPPPSGLIDLSCSGPMARLIRDVALCLDSVVGPHPADVRSLPTPRKSWCRALDSPKVPARVLWMPSIDGEPVDSEIVDVCTAAVESLAYIGVEVVESNTPLNIETAAFMQMFYGGLIAPLYFPLRGTDEWADVTDRLAEMIDKTIDTVSVSSLFEARRCAGKLSIRLAEVMAGFNVLLTPTVVGQTPISGEHGTINGDPAEDWVRFTPLANLTRRPAGSVCCGFTADGMPIGLQVIGHQLDDLTVLETIAVIEDLLALDTVAPLH